MSNHTTSPSLTQRLMQCSSGLFIITILYLCRFYLDENDFDNSNITKAVFVMSTVLSMAHYCTLSIQPLYRFEFGQALLFLITLCQCLSAECQMWISVSRLIALVSIDGLTTSSTTAAAYILWLLWNLVLVPIVVLFAFYIASYDYWDARDLDFWGALKLTGPSIWERFLLYIRSTFAWISSRFNRRQVTGSDQPEMTTSSNLMKTTEPTLDVEQGVVQ